MDQQVSLGELIVYGSSLNYRIEKFMRKLAGMTDLEDALKKLDRLTQEEARIANVEVLRLAHSIRDGVEIVDSKVEEVGDKVQVVIDGARGVQSVAKIFQRRYLQTESTQELRRRKQVWSFNRWPTT